MCKAYVYSTVAAALYHGRIVVVTLAPVARNLHIMRAAIAIDAVVVLASFWIFVSFLPINLMELQVHVLSGLAIDTCFAAYAIRILCGSNVARMRVQVWLGMGRLRVGVGARFGGGKVGNVGGGHLLRTHRGGAGRREMRQNIER